MQIPPIIFGTFQYQNQRELSPIVNSAYENGIIGFDTSPSYHTEEFLGAALEELCTSKEIRRQDLFIQDKIDGWQMEEAKGKISCHVETSIAKLHCNYIDALFIHWPFPEYLPETWQAFSDLKKQGKVRLIGLSNVRERHMKKLMEETGIRPDVVQIERHPLRTCKNDVRYFQSEGITVEAYSPVCRMDKRLADSAILKSIAQKYKKSMGQVILRWHIDTGVIPVFMTKKEARIKENVDIFDFSLVPEELKAISELDINYKIFVESACCPGI